MQTDPAKLQNWIQNLEKLIQTGNPSGLEMLKNQLKSNKEEDKIEHREDKVEQKERFDDEIKELGKNAPSSEYVEKIDKYLDLPEVTNKQTLLDYRILFGKWFLIMMKFYRKIFRKLGIKTPLFFIPK